MSLLFDSLTTSAKFMDIFEEISSSEENRYYCSRFQSVFDNREERMRDFQICLCFH